MPWSLISAMADVASTSVTHFVNRSSVITNSLAVGTTGNVLNVADSKQMPPVDC